MVKTLRYGVMLQHSRTVALQRARLQRSYYLFPSFRSLYGLSGLLAVSRTSRLPIAKLGSRVNLVE